MKRTLLLIALAVAASSAFAANVCGNDTIIKAMRPDSVVVTETDSTTFVKIFGNNGDRTFRFSYAKGFPAEANTEISQHTSNWDFTLPFKKNTSEHKAKFSFNFMSSVHVGAAIPVSKTDDVHANVGWQAGADVFNVALSLPSKRDELSIGLGCELYYLRQHKGWQWVKQDGKLATIPFANGTEHRRSWSQNLALTLPLHYKHEFKHTYFGLSVIPGYFVLSHVKNSYRYGSQRVKDKYKGLNHRRFDLAVRAEFGHNDWGGLYVQFNPYKSFTGAASPNFKLLTIGVTL